MEELSHDQYGKIKEAISFIRKHWWFFPDMMFWICAITSAVVYFYFQNTIYQKIALGVAIYSLVQLSYRNGVYYVFTRGYEDSHITGVHKALGLTPEDEADIHDRAIQMKGTKTQGRFPYSYIGF